MMQRLILALLTATSLIACDGVVSETVLPPAETTEPGTTNPERPKTDPERPTTDPERPTGNPETPIPTTTPGSDVDPGTGAGGRDNQGPVGNAGAANGNAGSGNGPGPNCDNVNPNNCPQACRCAGLSDETCAVVCDQ